MKFTVPLLLAATLAACSSGSDSSESAGRSPASDDAAAGADQDAPGTTVADDDAPATTAGVAVGPEGLPDDGRHLAIVDCNADTTTISPYIYGVSYAPWADPLDERTAVPIRRWGGNPTSRYNWEIGAWNTAFDYYFMNVPIGDNGLPGHAVFLDDNWRNGATSAVSIPMIGWVAADDESVSFPLSRFPDQNDVEPYAGEAGDGLSSSGDELDPLPPSATSVEYTPDDAAAFIDDIIDLAESENEPAPAMYFLDNEPMLWNSTHRDIITEPVSYDLLWERSSAYAQAIRKAQPDAMIAGPAVWGWPAYFWSALDVIDGFDRFPDRREHGDVDLIPWYLQQFAQLEADTGVRHLDVLDVHFYPQDGSYSSDADNETAARRIRSTRSLWDPNYLEESWIEDEVALIPRLHDWIDDNYPGTKISIGEYSFGGEDHISGAIAQAEALGRFGEGGVYSAFYWYAPPAESAVNMAFRAYLDYDGEGSGFLSESVPTDTDRPLSLFASTDPETDEMVLVAINLDLDESLETTINLGTCPSVELVEMFQYTGDQPTYESVSADVDRQNVRADLPAGSISVFRITPEP